jgi:penicillin amidase
VTLPGTPAVVAGTNGRVAWGLANAEGDLADVVILEPADGGDRYRTPGGSRRIDRRAERIDVRGGIAEPVETAWTEWGPLVEPDHRGRRRALRWVGHDPGAVDLRFLTMETAADVDEAIAIAPTVGAPTVNVVVADSTGRIGWTLLGPLPRRVGFSGRVPESWAGGGRKWEGYLEPGMYPRIVDPPGGRVWAANQRTVGGEAMLAIGDGGWALGARARQIRDGLATVARADERDMLAIQLDDRALHLARWRELLLRTLDAEAIAGTPARAEMRRLVEQDWSGRASVESSGYRLVREFRDETAQRVIGPLTARCRDADPRFTLAAIRRLEVPVWRLVTERPRHLLDPRYTEWTELLLEAADAVLTKSGPDDLAKRTWGERNRLALHHPLSAAVPFLGRWLDYPADALPGDTLMPRVQSPAIGASERMVVSPGREEHGLFHMPGGQSGHFLSPHYRAGHDAWVTGAATPLLPGESEHRLTLRPR